MALASPPLTSATSFFMFVIVVSFIITILLIFAYFLGIREALNVSVNWVFLVSPQIQLIPKILPKYCLPFSGADHHRCADAVVLHRVHCPAGQVVGCERHSGHGIQHCCRRLRAVQLPGLCGGHVLPVLGAPVGSHPLSPKSEGSAIRTNPRTELSVELLLFVNRLSVISSVFHFFLFVIYGRTEDSGQRT